MLKDYIYTRCVLNKLFVAEEVHIFLLRKGCCRRSVVNPIANEIKMISKIKWDTVDDDRRSVQVF